MKTSRQDPRLGHGIEIAKMPQLVIMTPLAAKCVHVPGDAAEAALEEESNKFSKGEKMNNKVLILLSCGTNNTNRSTRAIHLATVAHKEGKEVAVFLLDEAVYLAKEGIIKHVRAATGDIADDLLTYLQANGVPILVCTPCAKARQIEEKDLIEGARLALASEMIHMACESTVISL
jgi:predicted peroxiredoxin